MRKFTLVSLPLSITVCILAPLLLASCHRHKDIPTIAQESKPAVVQVLAYGEADTLIGIGTGFFISRDEIITNRHVIEFAKTAKIKLASGEEYVVTYVMGVSDFVDLIRLAVDVRNENIKPLPVRKELPAAGERVVVVGSPFGLQSTVSDGLISSIRESKGQGGILQITAPISPGSSGSPVIDMFGEVVGIATMQLTQGQNLNFALSSILVDSLKSRSATSLVDWQNETLKWKAKQPESYRIAAAKIREATEWEGNSVDYSDPWTLSKVAERKYDRWGNLTQEICYDKQGSITGRKDICYDSQGRVFVTNFYDVTGTIELVDSVRYPTSFEVESISHRFGSYPATTRRLVRTGSSSDTSYVTVLDSRNGKTGSSFSVTLRDAHGNVTEERDSLEVYSKITYQYSSNGLKMQETEESRTAHIVRSFDNLERVVHEVRMSYYPEGTIHSEHWYRYDWRGFQIEDDGVFDLIHPFKTTRAFDAFGNLEEENGYNKSRKPGVDWELKERRVIVYQCYE